MQSSDSERMGGEKFCICRSDKENLATLLIPRSPTTMMEESPHVDATLPLNQKSKVVIKYKAK